MIQEPTQSGGDLTRLHDVVAPPDVSLWPSAPGWQLLGAGVLLALVVLAALLVRRQRALGYRRRALAELSERRAADEPAALPGLLKRAALAAHRRQAVAALTGDAWSRFLDDTGGAGRFQAGAGEALERLAYGGARPQDSAPLFDAAEAWLRAQGPAR